MLEINEATNTETLLPTKENTIFFRAQLESLQKKGIVFFESKKFSKTMSKYWNGTSLKIPAYGVYKISWGFSKEVVEWFFNSDRTHLTLLKNNKEQIANAIIDKNTKCYYSKKSVHQSTSILLKEGDTISLEASIFEKENPNMKDLYFTLTKLDTGTNSTFGYVS